jgi:hypothetical protein
MDIVGVSWNEIPHNAPSDPAYWNKTSSPEPWSAKTGPEGVISNEFDIPIVITK